MFTLLYDVIRNFGLHGYITLGEATPALCVLLLYLVIITAMLLLTFQKHLLFDYLLLFTLFLQHPYVDIVDWYKKLASDNPSVPIKYVESIGKSVEGRDQPAVHIGSGDIQIYSQCQIHASKQGGCACGMVILRVMHCCLLL